MTTPLVLLDQNTKVGGLVRIEYHSNNLVTRALLAKVGLLSRTWNNNKARIEKELSAEVSKTAGKTVQVVLLNGNYVKQKKGVVSYHGSNPLGATYLQRKGWDAKTGTFWVWVILK